MNKDFVITPLELAEKGLNLSDYAYDETFIPAIINKGLSLTISRACKLGDLKSSQQLERYISEDDSDRTSEEKVVAFKEAQYRMLYNLIFMNETTPDNDYVDNCLVYELGMKINGFQKGYFRSEQ